MYTYVSCSKKNANGLVIGGVFPCVQIPDARAYILETRLFICISSEMNQSYFSREKVVQCQ